MYDPVQGEIVGVYLTDQTDRLLPTQKEDEEMAGVSILDRLRRGGASDAVIEQISAEFSKHSISEAKLFAVENLKRNTISFPLHIYATTTGIWW